MLDVPHGTGTTKSASVAPRTGSSTLTVSVCPFLTSVPHITKPEPVPHASRDTISSMVFVNSLPLTMLSPLMPDVVHGTGITKFVSAALRIGSSMLTVFVCPFLTTVPLTMMPVLALLATRDMT